MTRATLIGLSAFIAAIAMVAAVRQAWPHSWYDAACCSSRDCKPVDVREIGESGSDYVYQGMRFPKARSRPSMDSDYHVCVRPAAPFVPGRIFCIYRPSPGV